MELAEKVLNRLCLCKPQRKFLVMLFTTILVVRGKVNFRNLRRYSDRSEKTYSRQFAKAFVFLAFNRQLIDATIGTEGARVVAFDPSFVAKAGKKTYGGIFLERRSGPGGKRAWRYRYSVSSIWNATPALPCRCVKRPRRPTPRSLPPQNRSRRHGRKSRAARPKKKKRGSTSTYST